MPKKTPQKSFFLPTTALGQAIRKAAHRREMSQNRFIVECIADGIRKIEDSELQELMHTHDANMEEFYATERSDL